MHYFIYKKNQLYCEEVKVIDIVKKYSTPLYIYSAKTILDHFYKIKRAFKKISPLICYSVKANSNLSILRLLVKQGAGLDIVSGGELYRAKKVGCPPKRIVYASVGKTEEEIRKAISYGILMFNVESISELEKINRIAREIKKRIPVGIRINPNVEADTHVYTATAKEESKFGMDLNTVEKIFSSKNNYPWIEFVGLHIHIGSQITKSLPFIRAIKKVTPLIDKAKEYKVNLKYFDIGGGLGIVYSREKPQTAEEFAKRIIPLLEKLNLKIILEPGRFIVGNAGILVTKVLYVKDTSLKRFIIVDAAMNDLIRPALYDAYHRILPLRIFHSQKSCKIADVVGPVCETGDFLGKNRKLAVSEGEYLAVFGCGAYGFSMSSQYNSRPRSAEVLVRGRDVYLIRKRENYRDLIKKEVIVDL